MESVILAIELLDGQIINILYFSGFNTGILFAKNHSRLHIIRTG